jgi:outer membrane protein assembly factor BamA
MAQMLALAAALLLAQAEAPPAPEPPSRGYVVERIELRGLAATREDAVRRHLAVAEGHVLDDEAVLVSRLRLLQLGWYSQVEVRVEKGSQRGLVVLVFQLTERNTLIISDLVVGHTGPQPFYGGLGLSEQNFLGLGLGLSGAFVYGGAPLERAGDPDRFSARAAFFAPDIPLGGTLPRLVAGASLVWLRGEELTCPDPSCRDYRGHYGAAPRLRYERLGGEAVLGIRPGPFERLFAGFRLEGVEGLFLSGTGPSGPVPALASGRRLLSALTGTYDRDTRDDFFLPRDGTRFLAQVTFASPSLGGDYEYARWLVQAETAFALPRGHALKLLGAAGATQGDAPFFDRFYAADWAYFSVGPAVGRAMELNFSTDSRYDALLLTGGAEYAIPLWTSPGVLRRGYLAIGARELYTAARSRAARTAQSSTPFSADLALRLDTPVGSFNLSLGYAVDLFL